MFKKIKISFFLMMILILVNSVVSINAATRQKTQAEKEQDELLAKKYSGVYDLQKNSVSNIDFYTTNYGIFGFDVARSTGGTFWPRNSNNQYIFAGGLWFGAQKTRTINGVKDTLKYVSISYNPNSGGGWFVPGRINLGGPQSSEYPDVYSVDGTDISTYRTYFSIDFNVRTGEPLNPDDGKNWPIWDASQRIEDTLKSYRYFGYYIPNAEDRKLTNPALAKGPAFISGEDIFCTYKDTDLSRYEGGSSKRKEKGYPLKLQFEQMIYSWGFGDYKDFIFLKYEMTNYSKDTLYNCWLAPVMDVDIASKFSSSFGAGNDRVKFYTSDTTLNLAVQWSNADRGEYGNGFGYLGFDFLESPSVIKYYEWKHFTRDSIVKRDPPLDDTTYVLKDSVLLERPSKQGEEISDFVRKDKPYYSNEEQLGLVTFRNWSISDDKNEDEDRYNFISLGLRDGDTGPGDKRFMMASGPFHMRPSDTVRTVVGIVLATTSKGGEADGTDDDMAELVRKDKFAQDVYDNNFRAPQPPDRATIYWEGINNAIKITWDSTSELSSDKNERGLDFLGYRLYRARRNNLDTFDVNGIQGNAQYPSGKGPLGWKQIAQWQLPTPFYKSSFRSGTNGSVNNPFIDDLRIVGPYTDASGKIIDSMAIRIMRSPRGVYFQNDSIAHTITGTYAPMVIAIDTSMRMAPWGSFFGSIVKRDPAVKFTNDGFLIYSDNSYLTYNPSKKVSLFDSVMVGVAYLNRAIIKYNPMFYETKTVNRTKAEIDNLIKIFPDGIVGDTIQKYDTAGKMTVIRVTTDSIYNLSILRKAIINGVDMFVIDLGFPRPANKIMNDSSLVNYLLDYVYKGIQNSSIKTKFNNIEENEFVRQNVIGSYMKLVTNNRTYFDLGDNNSDNVISEDINPTKTERILNNVDYYYKILAYDEGDYSQPTPLKLNDGAEGLPNLTKATAYAAPVSKDPNFTITYVDSSKIGGLYNFDFFSINSDRLKQKFAGHELEMEFQPYWYLSSANFTRSTATSGATSFGLYRRLLTVKDLTTQDTVFMGYVSFEQNPCDLSYIGFITENASSFVFADTVIKDSISNISNDFGTRNSRGKKVITSMFTTGNYGTPNFCNTFGLRGDAEGTLGFKFDFTLQQWGGRYRPDSTLFIDSRPSNVQANTPINFADDYTNDFNTIMTTQPVNYDWVNGNIVYGSFNNGPGVYEIEFLPGGTETIELQYNKFDVSKIKTNTFEVPYLNIKVKNVISYKRPSIGNDSVDVTYPGEMTHMDIKPVVGKVKSRFGLGSGTEYSDLFKQTRLYPDPRNLAYDNINTNEFIGKFNIAAYPFVSIAGANRNKNTAIFTRNQIAIPKTGDLSDPTVDSYSGKQGKYYLTGVSLDKQDTVDFVNLLNIAGVQFAFDYANKGVTNNTTKKWATLPDSVYTPWKGVDFKAGDKITLKTFGGVLGLPMPGAKVKVKVSEVKSVDNTYEDSELDQIQVVPNPYYISHQAQKSPYDSKMFFTKLPRDCKIEIYTVSGDLVVTIDHKPQSSYDDSRASVEIWDLLTKNGMRVQSQSFNAVITTPDGAQTVKTFSVVVGGFRLIED